MKLDRVTIGEALEDARRRSELVNDGIAAGSYALDVSSLLAALDVAAEALENYERAALVAELAGDANVVSTARHAMRIGNDALDIIKGRADLPELRSTR